MSKQVIEFQIGINKSKKLIGLKFPRPTMMLEMGAQDALELAKELILRAKDIAESRDLQSGMSDLIKVVQ